MIFRNWDRRTSLWISDRIWYRAWTTARKIWAAWFFSSCESRQPANGSSSIVAQPASDDIPAKLSQAVDYNDSNGIELFENLSAAQLVGEHDRVLDAANRYAESGGDDEHVHLRRGELLVYLSYAVCGVNAELGRRLKLAREASGDNAGGGLR